KKRHISWRDFAPDFALKTGSTTAEGRCVPRRRPVLARQPSAARKPPITAGAAVRQVNGRLAVALFVLSSPTRKRAPAMFRTIRRLLQRRPRSRPATVRRTRLTLELLERRELLAQLTFLSQPLSTATGLTLNPITVSSSDGGTAPITVSLGNNQSGLLLQGTVT